MKAIRTIVATLVISAALAQFTTAGEIHSGIAPTPTPAQQTAPTTDGTNGTSTQDANESTESSDSGNTVLEAALAIVNSVLGLF